MKKLTSKKTAYSHELTGNIKCLNSLARVCVN